MITVATKDHVMLDLLKKQVRNAGEILTILGLELNKTIGWEAHGNLGLKLKLVHDFIRANDLNDDDILLFIDAYDVLYAGKKDAILEQFRTFEKPLVFGAETACSPDSSLVDRYPSSPSGFQFLNSGLFIGRVSALRDCFRDYVFDDSVNDQLWWTHKFLERPDLIELDYTNKIFLNCHAVNKHDILLTEGQITYKDRHPFFLHFNGTSKAIMNRYAKLDPNPYFTLFPHVSRDFYLAHGGE